MTNLSICDRPVTPAGNAAAVPAAEPAQDLAHWDDDKRADLGFHAWSLDAPLSGDDETASLADLLGDVDGQVEHALDMAAVSAHWNELPERQQRILLLRFYATRRRPRSARRSASPRCTCPGCSPSHSATCGNACSGRKSS